MKGCEADMDAFKLVFDWVWMQPDLHNKICGRIHHTGPTVVASMQGETTHLGASMNAGRIQTWQSRKADATRWLRDRWWMQPKWWMHPWPGKTARWMQPV